MSGFYPPGVSGSEPQICGDATEDKCVICLEKATEDMGCKDLPDGVIEVLGDLLCVSCLEDSLAEDGYDVNLLKNIFRKQTEN